MDVLRRDLEPVSDGYALGVRIGDEVLLANSCRANGGRELAAELRQRFIARGGWCDFD